MARPSAIPDIVPVLGGALATHPDVDFTVIDTQNHHLFQPLL